MSSIANKPKMLIGLNQKVHGQVQVFFAHLSQSLHHRQIGETSPTQVLEWNVVSSLFSRLVGRSQDQPMGQWVKDAGESECLSVMDRIGIGKSQKMALCPTRKRADFQRVLNDRRSEAVGNGMFR